MHTWSCNNTSSRKTCSCRCVMAFVFLRRFGFRKGIGRISQPCSFGRLMSRRRRPEVGLSAWSRSSRTATQWPSSTSEDATGRKASTNISLAPRRTATTPLIGSWSNHGRTVKSAPLAARPPPSTSSAWPHRIIPAMRRPSRWRRVPALARWGRFWNRETSTAEAFGNRFSTAGTTGGRGGSGLSCSKRQHGKTASACRASMICTPRCPRSISRRLSVICHFKI